MTDLERIAVQISQAITERQQLVQRKFRHGLTPAEADRLTHLDALLDSLWEDQKTARLKEVSRD